MGMIHHRSPILWVQPAMIHAKHPTVARSLVAALLPLAVCPLQWLCWSFISPFVWFLFYPTVFLSSWLGGFGAGLVSTFLSTALVWWYFMPPVHTLLKPRPGLYLNVVVFMAMGLLFSFFHRLLREAERKVAQAALKEQDVRLDRMSRLAKVGGWEFDPVTGAGSWTEEVARIHDLEPTAQPTVSMGLSYYQERGRPLIAEAVRRVVEERVPYDLELELVSATGAHKWVRTIGEPVVEGDRVVKVQGALQDVTERKALEQELQRMNATLERRVEERTGELRAANGELESFAYAVSHDLRAPLRAMDGFSKALLEDYGETLPAEGRSFLDQIGLASRRMAGLIDGLLQLSRATRGTLERVPLDLSELAGGLLEDLAKGEPERHVLWEVEPGIHVQGDPRMLEAALSNLLGNAWKYTARIPEARIRMDTVQEEGLRWIRIRDNGCGFDMAHAEKLFKPFQRLHRQDEFPGLGIGLATVQRIVMRHGGSLKASAAPGRGASFLFSLPLPNEPEQP